MYSKNTIKLIANINVSYNHLYTPQFLMQLQDGRLAMTIVGTVYIYSIKNFRCELILQGPSLCCGTLQIIQCKNGRIIGWSEFRLVIWKISRKSYIREFFGIVNVMDLIEMTDGIIAYTNLNNELILINSYPPFDVIDIFDLADGSFDVLFHPANSNIFFAFNSSIDGIQFFTNDTFKKVCTLAKTGIFSKRSVVELNQDKIFLPTYYGNVYLFNIKICQVESIYSFNMYKTIDIAIKIQNNLILCVNSCGQFLFIDDLFNKIQINTIPTYMEINSLCKINKNYFLSLSQSLSIWKLMFSS